MEKKDENLPDGRFGSKVPILLYFVKPKRPSVRSNVSLLTEQLSLLLFEGIEGIPMCALFFPLDFEGKIHWYRCNYPLFQ